MTEHLAGINSNLSHTLLSIGSLPKPTLTRDHLIPLAPLHQPWYMLGLGRVVKWRKTHHVEHTRPPLAPLSLASISTHPLVLEHLHSLLIITLHGPSTSQPAIGPNWTRPERPGRARARMSTSLDTTEHALAWTPSSSSHSLLAHAHPTPPQHTPRQAPLVARAT
jgi:hypothetical protein